MRTVALETSLAPRIDEAPPISAPASRRDNKRGQSGGLFRPERSALRASMNRGWQLVPGGAQAFVSKRRQRKALHLASLWLLEIILLGRGNAPYHKRVFATTAPVRLLRRLALYTCCPTGRWITAPADSICRQRSQRLEPTAYVWMTGSRVILRKQIRVSPRLRDCL